MCRGGLKSQIHPCRVCIRERRHYRQKQDLMSTTCHMVKLGTAAWFPGCVLVHAHRLRRWLGHRSLSRPITVRPTRASRAGVTGGSVLRWRGSDNFGRRIRYGLERSAAEDGRQAWPPISAVAHFH